MLRDLLSSSFFLFSGFFSLMLRFSESYLMFLAMLHFEGFVVTSSFDTLISS